MKNKRHPWRRCPPGRHWVKVHDRDVQITEKNPDGVTEVDGHCRDNPSRKDHMYADEIRKISSQQFGNFGGIGQFKKKPGRIGWNKHDSSIVGWTKYWNEVLEPKTLLDPNVVKALISSESSFHPNPTKNRKIARGLLQFKPKTLKYLSDPKGELGDYLINADLDDMLDPDVAIYVGVRWLFQKQKLAANKLGREATWDEAVANYKGYLRDIISGKPAKGMNVFRQDLEELKSWKQ